MADTYVTAEQLSRRIRQIMTDGESIRAAQVAPPDAETTVRNTRVIEHYSRAQNETIREVVVNPLYEPTQPNGVLGRRVSHEGLDWGLYSIKHDYVGREEDYDNDHGLYWRMFEHSVRQNLEAFETTWDPTIIF